MVGGEKGVESRVGQLSENTKGRRIIVVDEVRKVYHLEVMQQLHPDHFVSEQAQHEYAPRDERNSAIEER